MFPFFVSNHVTGANRHLTETVMEITSQRPVATLHRKYNPMQ